MGFNLLTLCCLTGREKATIRDGGIVEGTYCNRLTRFRSGNCDLVGRQRSSRPVVIDDNEDELQMKNIPVHMIRKVAEILHI